VPGLFFFTAFAPFESPPDKWVTGFKFAMGGYLVAGAVLSVTTWAIFDLVEHRSSYRGIPTGLASDAPSRPTARGPSPSAAAAAPPVRS
jgi:hypothetical protein